MTTSEVEAILCAATNVEIGTIPPGSVVGLQQSFRYQLLPGDSYLQWRYLRGGNSYYFWFACDAVGEWRLTAKARWPSIVDRST